MLPIQEYSRLYKTLDMLMVPLMYVLQGNFSETPQRTHLWNRIAVSGEQLKEVKKEMCIVASDPHAHVRAWVGPIPLMHVPILGGWNTFIVLTPTHTDRSMWYVGWITSKGAQLSKVPLCTSVRVLLHKHAVHFFGVEMHTAIKYL